MFNQIDERGEQYLIEQGKGKLEDVTYELQRDNSDDDGSPKRNSPTSSPARRKFGPPKFVGLVDYSRYGHHTLELSKEIK